MRIRKVLVLSFVALFMFLFSTSDASAKVMWGKTELKQGQIGKVTILRETPVVKLDDKGNISSVVKRAHKGEEFRVYSYQNKFGGLYGLGGGLFVQKNEVGVKYETPSKTKLALLEGKTTQPDKPKENIDKEYSLLNAEMDSLIKDIKSGISQKDFATRSNSINEKLIKFPQGKQGKFELEDKYKKLFEMPEIQFKRIIFEFSDGQRTLYSNNDKFGEYTMFKHFTFEGKLYLNKRVIEDVQSVAIGFYDFESKNLPEDFKGITWGRGTIFTDERKYIDNSSLDSPYYIVYKLLNPKNNKELIIEDKRSRQGYYNWDVLNPYSIEDFTSILDLDVSYTYDKQNHTLTFKFPEPLKEPYRIGQ
ncbi:hypothetical protein KHA94_13385 [Bacillus sp. FJAT-49705]|uniref:Uncharacterized protein n=1 Tax=Cytobacillus citreus TaxID=2833586 RepID=A0ABS5NTL0_9BACI|nr:hypothetical protein [Cytobacillus citreus]MBS4191176.1 hypothetical protein [Cytobacillus citreus]